MKANKLDWLAGAAQVDIFGYVRHDISPISVGKKRFSHGLLLRAVHCAQVGLYTIVQYQNIYMMVIPTEEKTGLLLLPKLDPVDKLRNVFTSIDFVNHSINTAKLAYHLATNKEAPDWEITLIQLHGAAKAPQTTKPMADLVAFHIYTVKMIDAITNLDDKKFKESLEDMKGCQIFGQALATDNIIRGQKDILIDLISKLSDNLGKFGLPIERVIEIQTNSIQKIEYQANVLNFDAWVQEIPWIFFNEFKSYRQSLLQDQAERIKDYITNHVQDNLKLKDIAGALDISSQKMNIIFKQKFHATIKQFSIRIKIEAARQLLMTTRLKIKDIADYLSFADESYFVVTFSKLIGVTPAKFRLSQLQERNVEQKNSSSN